MKCELSHGFGEVKISAGQTFKAVLIYANSLSYGNSGGVRFTAGEFDFEQLLCQTQSHIDLTVGDFEDAAGDFIEIRMP